LKYLVEFLAGDVTAYVTMILRFIIPFLAGVILFRCARSFLRDKPEEEVWGYLCLPNGGRISLNHWENIIGRNRSCDALMEYPTISRNHAAIIRNGKGEWKIYDLKSKSGIRVNNKEMRSYADVKHGDVITMGGVGFTFLARSEEELSVQAAMRTKPGGEVRPALTLLLLTEMQILLGIQHYIAMGSEAQLYVPIAFAALSVIMWIYFLFMCMMRRRGVEVETIAFFLCTLGLSVVATDEPTALAKQIIFIVAGIVLFLCLGFFLRSLERTRKLRWPIAILGVLLLAVTLVIAETTNGARNWISIGGFSLQPSEFVKICFVFAGATTMDRLFAKRNLIYFMGFSALCVIVLGLMSDFGTALVFFVSYLVIAFMRSGDFATILLSAGGAGLGGFLILTVKPYVASRFSTWGKAWQFPHEGGYQQTRTMSAAASGGLFGVGAGEGWLHTVVAAETDMVFGIICEEFGLITAILAIFGIVLLAFFAIRSASCARSTLYVIGACAAVSMLLVQLALNVFGSLDILPFTGVTFPFVSRGGSSLIACWGLLAFIKAADTRQNASFAIKNPKRLKKYNDYD